MATKRGNDTKSGSTPESKALCKKEEPTISENWDMEIDEGILDAKFDKFTKHMLQSVAEMTTNMKNELKHTIAQEVQTQVQEQVGTRWWYLVGGQASDARRTPQESFAGMP